MALEPNFRYLDDLDPGNPANNDPVAQGPAHLRGIKGSLLANVRGNLTEAALRFNDADRVRANGSGLQVSGGLTPRLSLVSADLGTTLAELLADDPELELRNARPGGRVVLTGRDAGDTETRSVFTGDPEGAAQLNHAGERRLATAPADGDIVTIWGDDSDPDELGRQMLVIRSQSGSARAYFGKVNTAYATTRVTSSEYRIEVGGSSESHLRAIAGGATQLGFAAVPNMFETTNQGFNVNRPAGANAIGNFAIDGTIKGVLLATTSAFYVRGGPGNQARLEGDNGANPVVVGGANVTDENLFYGGGAAVLRLRPASIGNSRGTIMDSSGAVRPIGYNVMPREDFAGSRTLQESDIGRRLRYTGSGNATVTVANLEPGATLVIQNGTDTPTSTGTVTLAGGTIRWLSGAGVITGNRVLSNGGIVTLTHEGSNIWVIYGNGIS